MTITKTTIEIDKDIITLINVFTVDASKQLELVNALIDTTKRVWHLQDGFISASIHKSVDGKKVVNYVQWKGKQAFDKRLDDPQAIIQMNKILSMAKADGHLYEVVFTDVKE
ncbi:MAG: antibiotic biosynthesis monooxygenase [Candidatus Nitrosocosmicus sp.]|nr:antibiotic biosynthesis monooxygenase [Candidatus Nitrosocosmicus sp.]MDN5867959.1 antibiotic biosynthesis monooxygenase [Candidatus Nitrosocosmicus sp.]